MCFLDVYKFHIRSPPPIYLHEGYLNTIWWIHVGFVCFLIATIFAPRRIEIINTSANPLRISERKFNDFVIPLSVLVLCFVLTMKESISSQVLFLLSFIPKSVVILLFFFYLKTKKKKYLLLAVLFVFFAYMETSRRIYITLILTLVPLYLSKKINDYGFLQKKYKVMLLLLFVAGFLLMNILRSSHYNYGQGYIEGDPVQSTINYMLQLKALDTFDNTAFVLRNFPHKYEYYYGITYFATLVQMIPRSVWKNKPVSFGAPLALLKYGGIRNFSIYYWKKIVDGLSLSPGFIGEAYANFGIAGIIIISSIFGVIVTIYDRNIEIVSFVSNISILPLIPFYGSFFIMLRGDFVMATYFSILFFLSLKALIYIITVKSDQ